MKIQTKFKIGDNIMLGKIQLVINRIRVNVGLIYPSFNKEKVLIEYQVNDKNKIFYSWIQEELLKNVNKIKFKTKNGKYDI